MVTLYSKYFTNDEIQYYIDFYATPAGKKMLELTPTIQKEFMTSFMANDMPSFQAKLKVKLDEMHKKYPASNEPTVKNKYICGGSMLYYQLFLLRLQPSLLRLV